MGYLIAFLIFILALLVYIIYIITKGHILVDEMEIAVIFNKRNKSFAYFIDPDLDPTEKINNFAHKRFNKTLPKYHYFINPFTEKREDTISKGAHKSGEIETEARTKEGIAVKVHWGVACRIDVTKIKSGIEHKMARGLPKNAGNMVKGKGVPSVRHIIEQKTIYQLYGEDAIKELEIELAAATTEKAAIFGMFGIGPGNQLQIQSIEMPPQIERALKVAHQRKIQTETVTEALNGLKKAIADFSPEDMERLAELERLRLVDQNSASMVYWMNNSLKNKNGDPPENGVQQESN